MSSIKKNLEYLAFISNPPTKQHYKYNLIRNPMENEGYGYAAGAHCLIQA